RDSGNTDVWLHDLEHKTRTRLTFDPSPESFARWFGNGRVVYTSRTNDVEESRGAIVASDGSGGTRELGKAYRATVTPDGRYVVYLNDNQGQRSLLYRTLANDAMVGETQRVFKTDPQPTIGAFNLSPDGQFVEFSELLKGGGSGFFVTRFPSGDGRWQIWEEPRANGNATATGQVRWSRRGDELYFLAASPD